MLLVDRAFRLAYNYTHTLSLHKFTTLRCRNTVQPQFPVLICCSL